MSASGDDSATYRVEDAKGVQVTGPGGVQHNNFFSGPRAAWTVGIIAAVVVGAVLTAATAYFVGWSSAGDRGSSASGTPAAAPEPFTVAVSDRTSPCGGGWLVPEGAADVPPASLGFDDEYREWASRSGVVAVGTSRVELAIQGRSAAQVVLRDMRVKVVDHAAPVRGTRYGLEGCGGDGIYRWMSADLDVARPVLKAGVDNDLEPEGDGEQRRGPVRFPYKVALDDTELFLVDGYTAKCLCGWVIEVDWSSEGRSGTKVVDDGGRPFRTTAESAVIRSCQKRQFEPVDPATDCHAGAGV